MSEEALCITETRSWVSSVVIGLNFCPFAKREFERNSIRYLALEPSSLNDALLLVFEECVYLSQHPEAETSLLIFPKAFKEFSGFLELVSLAEALLKKQGWEGVYQLAHFHPDYVFEGASSEDASNYTNRSPYPTLHLLREASIERALERYPHPESIPERNIRYARDLGVHKLRALLLNCRR